MVVHNVHNTFVELNKWFTRCQWKKTACMVFGHITCTYSVRIAIYLYHENIRDIFEPSKVVTWRVM